MSFPSSQIYYINSTHRLSGSHGHFTYQLKLPANCNFDRVCLLQANVPISYYLIPANYNKFVLTERKAGVDTTVDLTIPVGNYNASSFASLVPPLLNAASPNHWIYTMTFPSSFSAVQTAKFTYTVVGPTSVAEYATFTFTQDMCEQFGFDENTSNILQSTLVSKNIVSFVPETSILIHSDIVNDGDTDIFEVIFANNNVPLSNATYQCQDVAGYSKRLRTSQANAYSFSLTDEHGKQLDLNGLSCIFTIILFKQDTLTENIKDLIKLTASK